MGSSASASLTFGIDLGTEELPWDEEYLEDLLSKEANHPEWRDDMTCEENSKHWAGIKELMDNAPVDLVRHGYEGDSYIIAIPGYNHQVEWGDTEAITNTLRMPNVDEFVNFKKWCKNHGIEDAQPTWLLSASYF